MERKGRKGFAKDAKAPEEEILLQISRIKEYHFGKKSLLLPILALFSHLLHLHQ
jgi:hypothetical protein